MSPATDGFSAMMSFLLMRRERPQRILAKTSGGKLLARRARVWSGEQILGQQPAGGCLLVPQHHQRDELQLLEAQRLARGGERALDHEFARLRIEDAGVLERDQ